MRPAREPRRHRRAAVGLALAVLMFAVACSDESPSTLRPGGPGARRIEDLWWVLFWCSVVVCVIVIGGVVVTVMRRNRSGKVSHRNPVVFVVIAGAVIPFVVLAVVYGLNLRDMLALSEPENAAANQQPLTIDVIGHQWWWEFRYPDSTKAVSGNELHVPVGTDVKLRLRTDDVLHSFWVPQLMPKTDLIAGQTNTMWLRVDKPGNYRGQCAEYCGMQHAHMAFMVVAEPRDQFDAWLAWAGAPVRPQTPAQQRGQQVFAQMGCASCHTIRGTDADGTVAPDLTTVGDRWTLGAGTLPNDPAHMRDWISNSQNSKPGNAMPPQAVPPAQMDDLIAYLRSLKQPQGGVS